MEEKRGIISILLAVVVLAMPAYAQEPEDAGQQEKPSAQVADDSSQADDGYALDSVLKTMRADLQKAKQALKAREAKFAEKRDEARQRLQRAEAKMAELEKTGAALEASFETNRVELDNKVAILKDKLGALKELFGVFQQNASDLIGAFNGSPTSIQYPNRDQWLEGFANRMKNASEVSSVDDIMGLWFEMQREITALGDIVRLTAPVVDSKGNAEERSFVRIGGFSLITNEPEPAYLVWADSRQQVISMSRQPEGEYLGQIDSYLQAGDGLHAVSVDPTGSTLTALLVQKPTLVERIQQGGLVGYIILFLGLLTLLLAVYKLFDITLISLRVRAQQRDTGNPRRDNVLGVLLQVYRDNRHADSETLEMRLHEAVQKGALRVNRFTIFLAIIAAAAPLLGLLGTVVGMINTFQAITLYGTGDPQIMAGGISQALVTTVLGLIVAVPSVLLHAVVSGRAKSVINVLQQHSVELTGDQIQRQHSVRPPVQGSGSGPEPGLSPA